MKQLNLFQIDDSNKVIDKVIDKENTKQCRICKEYKSFDNFYLDRGAVYSKCKKCCKEYDKGLKTAKENAPPKPKDNKCECCGVEVTKWYCDHHPNTSKFRGWVCFKCNNAAGSVGDSYEGAVKLFNYLYGRRL